MRRILAITIIAVAAVSPARAQVDWFPEQYEEGAARALVDRLTEIGVEMTASEAERIEGGRRMIRDLVGRVDAWNLEGAIEHAPELAEVDLPEFDDRIVAAIAAYGVCALPLHPELVETNDEKIYVALGEVSVAIVSALLRSHFLEAGGTDEQLAVWLNSDRMNQLSYDIQVSEEQRNYVAMACGPMFSQLFGD